MSVLTKNPAADIPVFAVGDPADFNKHRRIVAKVIEGMSPRERKVLAGRKTRVHIECMREEGGPVGYWNPGTDTVHLFVDPPKPEYPECMKPLIADFSFVAAHEMHHPLIYTIAHRAGRYDEAYKRAHKQAVTALKKDRSIGKKIEEITHAMHRHHTFGAPQDAFLNIDYGWKKLDPGNREQLGVLLGVLLSDDYHEVYAYTMRSGSSRIDGRYEEVLCNVKALAHVFGEDKVREFAGGLLDYIEKLTPGREPPDKMPRGGKRAESHAARASARSGGVSLC